MIETICVAYPTCIPYMCNVTDQRIRTYPNRREAYDERDDVWQHVVGISDQRQRAGYVADDNLDQEKRRCEADHRQQPTTLPTVSPHTDRGLGGSLWATGRSLCD